MMVGRIYLKSDDWEENRLTRAFLVVKWDFVVLKDKMEKLPAHFNLYN